MSDLICHYFNNSNRLICIITQLIERKIIFSSSNGKIKLHSKIIVKICQPCSLFHAVLTRESTLEGYSGQDHQICMCWNIFSPDSSDHMVPIVMYNEIWHSITCKLCIIISPLTSPTHLRLIQASFVDGSMLMINIPECSDEW